MGKPTNDKQELKKGAWNSEEDSILIDFVQSRPNFSWKTLPSEAGLRRTGKSCRNRWKNYLKPGLKHGDFSQDEDDLIMRMHNLLGNRWSLIAGRLPGRTDTEIKNYWNNHLNKKMKKKKEIHYNLHDTIKTSDINCSSNNSDDHEDKQVEMKMQEGSSIKPLKSTLDEAVASMAWFEDSFMNVWHHEILSNMNSQPDNFPGQEYLEENIGPLWYY